MPVVVAVFCGRYAKKRRPNNRDRINQVHVFFFVFHFELTAFLRWPALKSFSSTHRFRLETNIASRNLCDQVLN